MSELLAEQHTELLPFPFAQRFRVLMSYSGDAPVLVSAGKPLPNVLKEIRRVICQPFTVEMLPDDEFDARLSEAYQQDSSAARQLMHDLGNDEELHSLAEELPDNEDLLEAEDGAPIIRMINAMLSEAIRDGASDIHIETFENNVMIRFRVDGVLREILKPQRKLATVLVSRIKVMAKLDIAEKRIPQDGRISLKLGGRAVDVRVSTLPSRHGERIVMRLLDRNSVKLDLSALGMNESICSHLRGLLSKPHGVVLVTGPTGSGKSTTLYAGISEINDVQRNIMTVEDPVEYDLEGVAQTQVNSRVDMTFARGLRAILRQDPDVVMVGEIRDVETARIAVQASLTGHLVLSTLHTNTSVGAVTRLRDMGIEPFLLSSSLLGVLAQRLVRTLCEECREAIQPTESEKHLLKMAEDDPRPIWQPSGCSQCNHSGYKGRTGIHELFLVDDEIRHLIHDEASEQSLEQAMRKHSAGIGEDGVAKVLAGITSLSEVLRVTRES